MTEAIFALPFYREREDLSIPSPELPKIFYTNYQLFCLKTRLSAYLVRLRLPPHVLTFEVDPLRLTQDGPIRLYATLRRFDEILKLEPETHNKISQRISEILARRSEYAALYSTAWSNPKVIPCGLQRGCEKSYLTLLLRYAPIPDRYNPILQDDGEDVQLLVRLPQPRFDIYVPNVSDYQPATFNEAYEDLAAGLDRWLSAVISKHVVYCTPAFAQRWGLEPVYRDRSSNFAQVPFIQDENSGVFPQLVLELEDQEDAEKLGRYSFYAPRWRRVRFAPQPRLFLEQRLAGETTVTWNLSNSPSLRHEISKRLPYIASFRYDKLYLQLDSLAACMQVESAIWEAEASEVRDVASLQARTLQEAEEILARALSEGVTDATIYSTENRIRPYTVSLYTLPGEEPGLLEILVGRCG